VRKSDRTGTGTLSVFAHQMRFDLGRGFPLVTTKKIHLRSLVYELLVVPACDTNVAWLREHDVTIWDEWRMSTVSWARSTAGSGVPGRQPTDAPSTRSPRPSSGSGPTPIRRRIMVSAWNVGELERMRLMPCHAFFQFYAAPGGCPVSSTSAARTFLLGYRSTSPA